MKSLAILAAGAALLAAPADAQDANPIAQVEAQKDRTQRVAQQIWQFAELGYLETQSSGLLVDELQREALPSVRAWPVSPPPSWPNGGQAGR